MPTSVLAARGVGEERDEWEQPGLSLWGLRPREEDNQILRTHRWDTTIYGEKCYERRSPQPVSPQNKGLTRPRAQGRLSGRWTWLWDLKEQEGATCTKGEGTRPGEGPRLQSRAEGRACRAARAPRLCCPASPGLTAPGPVTGDCGRGLSHLPALPVCKPSARWSVKADIGELIHQKMFLHHLMKRPSFYPISYRTQNKKPQPLTSKGKRQLRKQAQVLSSATQTWWHPRSRHLECISPGLPEGCSLVSLRSLQNVTYFPSHPTQNNPLTLSPSPHSPPGPSPFVPSPNTSRAQAFPTPSPCSVFSITLNSTCYTCTSLFIGQLLH